MLSATYGVGPSEYELLEDIESSAKSLEESKSHENDEESLLKELQTLQILKIKPITQPPKEAYRVTLAGGLHGLLYPLTEQDLHTPFFKITAYRLSCLLGVLERTPTVIRSFSQLDQLGLKEPLCLTGSLEYAQTHPHKSRFLHLKIKSFCEKKPFSPSVLIEFIVGLEAPEALAAMSAPDAYPDATLEALKKLDLESLKSHIFQKESLCPFRPKQQQAYALGLLKRRDAVLRHFTSKGGLDFFKKP